MQDKLQKRRKWRLSKEKKHTRKSILAGVILFTFLCTGFCFISERVKEVNALGNLDAIPGTAVLPVSTETTPGAVSSPASIGQTPGAVSPPASIGQTPGAAKLPEDAQANPLETADEGAWNLKLVNQSHPLDSMEAPELKLLSNGLKFDARAIGALEEMLAGAKNAGLSPIVCSAYRTYEKQKMLYENQVKNQQAKGLDLAAAQEKAKSVVAYPGTSEHNLGLAADIVPISYQLLDEKQADTDVAKWLAANCQEYGFILRYPKDKTEITGVIYEPWHFRYVGVEAAREIMKQGICLEEYLGGTAKK